MYKLLAARALALKGRGQQKRYFRAIAMGSRAFISFNLNMARNAANANMEAEPIQVDETAQRLNFTSIAAKYNGKREIYK